MNAERHIVELKFIIMKKSIYLGILLIFMIGLPLSSKADGIVITRNSCDWTTTGWMYVAKARTFKLGIWGTNKNGGCSIGSYYAERDNGCAFQWAQNHYGAHYEGGSVYKNKRICARGNKNSDLFYDLYNSSTFIDDSYYEKGEYSTARVVFNSSSVVMDSINILLEAKGTDLFSSFEIMMWLPEKNDTVATLDKAFLHGKIVLMNGKAQGTGVFKDIPLRVSKDAEGIYSVTVSNFKAIGVLPEGITNENSVIEVMTSSDAGIDEKSAISSALINDEISVSAFPNPSSDLVNISMNNITEDETFSVTIYDLNGKVITTLEEGISAIKLKTYQFSLSEAVENKGQYFILIKSLKNKRSVLKKILYQ